MNEYNIWGLAICLGPKFDPQMLLSSHRAEDRDSKFDDPGPWGKNPKNNNGAALSGAPGALRAPGIVIS